MKFDDSISILVCSRGRREDLERLVDGLKNIDYSQSIELIVVEETNHPIPITGIRYIPHPVSNRGIPYSRNLALSHATGDLIVFLDDDCIISDGWLDKLLEPFKDESVVGVQGGVTVPQSTNAIGWAESILGFPGGGIKRLSEANGENQETKEISTLNCAYRKCVIKKIGGFDENLKLGAEDYLLAKHACSHGRCLFVPKAIISHEARGNLIKIWQWFVRRGRAEIRLIRANKQEETTFWTIFRGSISIKILFLLAVGIPFSSWFMFIIFIALLLYYSAQCVRYYETWKYSRTPLKVLLLVPIVKLTMDFAMDWGRLRGMIFD